MAKAETLHEALASLAIFSTSDRNASLYCRRLWRESEYLGEFTASEAWELVHQLRTTA